MISVCDANADCDSRLTYPLSAWCSHQRVRLKSKRLSSSSAETTRVASAARADAPNSMSEATTAQDIFLKVPALKGAATITQPRYAARLPRRPGSRRSR